MLSDGMSKKERKSMVPKFLILLLSGLFFKTAAFANDINIVIAADDWCPLNCEVGTKTEGYVVDIAREIFKGQGYDIVYENHPWVDTLEKVAKGDIDAAIAATPVEAPTALFPKEEIGVSEYVYLLRVDDDWHFKDGYSLMNKKIGVMKGYDYSGSEFGHYVTYRQETKKNLVLLPEESSIDERLDMLANGEIDIFIEDRNVLLYALLDLKRQRAFKIGGVVGTTAPLYLAFAPSGIEHKKWVEMFDKGMDELRKSGKLKEMLAKYGLQDWRVN